MKTRNTLTICMLFVFEVVLLQGCATPTVVTSKQAGDPSLSCDQLRTQYDEALDFEAKARKERTVTGTNVAAAVLFWPALLGTYSNTEEAINAAKERQAHLQKLADGKKCRWDQAKSDNKPEAVAPLAATPEIIPTPAVTPTLVLPSTPVQQIEQMGVADVQRRLLELGYQPGKADGAMGPRTKDALKKFQRDKNLPVTGRVDNDTIRKLRQ